jgi:hypothetical protein
MKRIWIVSELYYPEQNATGRIMTAIAEAMTEFYEVGAICAQPTYDARGTKANAAYSALTDDDDEGPGTARNGGQLAVGNGGARVPACACESARGGPTCTPATLCPSRCAGAAFSLAQPQPAGACAGGGAHREIGPHRGHGGNRR